MRDVPSSKVAVKIFIDNQPNLHAEMTALIQSFFPDLSPTDMTSNLSKHQHFVSLTYYLELSDDSQVQLHQLYACLSQHPQVKMVL